MRSNDIGFHRRQTSEVIFTIKFPPTLWCMVLFAFQHSAHLSVCVSMRPSSCSHVSWVVSWLCVATGQYSSFGVCALGLMLGVLDPMEVELQDREQVEVKEKVDARETRDKEEEDKTRKQQTLKLVMTSA